MTTTADTTADSGPLSPDALLDLYRRMYLIRRFESRTGVLYRDGEIPGFVHLAVGQEATAVGACSVLEDRDVITSTHRGHGHALARGLTPTEMFAELMGRETGVCRGRGGSMHIADPGRGIFSANGIVGAGIPIALGAAFATRYSGTGGVVVAFLGDGAIATGAFHEAANLASLWKLPLILFCENNRFSEFSTFQDQHPVELDRRAEGYGLDFHRVDGNDVSAVHRLMEWVTAYVRAGGGPCLVEAVTLRHHGHYEGDPQRYRSDNPNDLNAVDPLSRTRAVLHTLGVHAADVEALHVEVDREIEDAISQARADPLPEPADLDRGMLVVREIAPPALLEPLTDPDSDGETWKLFQAINAALTAELEDDPSVFLAGIDVGKGGNIFGVTRGLYERWPERLWDTPISETAIMGLGTGAAMPA